MQIFNIFDRFWYCRVKQSVFACLHEKSSKNAKKRIAPNRPNFGSKFFFHRGNHDKFLSANLNNYFQKVPAKRIAWVKFGENQKIGSIVLLHAKNSSAQALLKKQFCLKKNCFLLTNDNKIQQINFTCDLIYKCKYSIFLTDFDIAG